jgi:recombination protein RecR
VKIPKPIRNLIESFQKLPGIGPKTAQRLTYYLLHVPQEELEDFSDALSNLKKDTVLCSICRNVSEGDPCMICADASRDVTQLMVVEQPLDILAFERTGKYKGVYHVLHGAISPLDNIGPDEIYIADLVERIKERDGKVIREVIIATNPTMEGDATAMYISKKIKGKGLKVKLTRLGMGIPTGADLEYADETTLTQAIEGRKLL